jgi:hypothetical protein
MGARGGRILPWDGNGEKIRYLAGSTNTALPSGTDVWQRVQPSLRHSIPCSCINYWHPTFELSRRSKSYHHNIAPNPKTGRPSFLPQRALGKGELDSRPSVSLHKERGRRKAKDIRERRQKWKIYMLVRHKTRRKGTTMHEKGWSNIRV